MKYEKKYTMFVVVLELIKKNNSFCDHFMLPYYIITCIRYLIMNWGTTSEQFIAGFVLLYSHGK